MMRMRYLLGFFALAGLSCQTVKVQPAATAAISTPEIWSAARKGQHAKISTGWLAEFGNGRMNSLVREALRNNYNLKTAAENLRIAKNGTIIGKSNRLPSVSSSTSYSRRNLLRSGSSGNFALSLDASWEADLWGRLRNQEQTSRANYAAQLADYRGARLSLAANTARQWCNLVTADRQLELAKKTLASYEQALPAVERGYLATTLRAVDLQFARSNIANAERSIRQRQLARDNAARNLELLLGRYPAASVVSSTELPILKKTIPAGLPASLLERRPDLARSRALLYASAQNAELAQKNLLPGLRLTGGADNRGDISRVLDPNFLLFSAAASLSQTIYNGGRLKAQARQALSRNRIELNNYAQDALEAFREVEATLGAEHSLKEQEIFLTREVEQTTKAESRTLRDITLGIPGASFLDYLEAQRRAEIARASLINLRNQRLQNRINLHLALGGDFFTQGSK